MVVFHLKHYNERHTSFREITGIWHLDTSQCTWQNAEGLKTLMYYKLVSLAVLLLQHKWCISCQDEKTDAHQVLLSPGLHMVTPKPKQGHFPAECTLRSTTLDLDQNRNLA